MRTLAGAAIRGGLSSSRLPFIGREEERRLLEEAIRGGTRLLTIAGPSGMGKTSLARLVAAGLMQVFEGEGGVWFCDLAAAKTAVDFKATVASTLGMAVRGDGAALALGLESRGRLLLILDNAEYLVEEAAAVIEAWLDDSPDLQILTTSLVPFSLPGETCFTLGPLQSHEAVSLYVDRAGRTGSRAPPDRLAIEALVERLDRIPLAIELAAGRALVLPPGQFLNRIGRRFELLQTERPGRHRSLEQAISCSWDLLDPFENVTLAQMSIFSGGCTLEAAERVLEPGQGAPSMLEVLSSLRSKGLLQLEDAEPPRLSTYESLREVAAERLDEMGEVDATALRHASYYLAAGEKLAEALDGKQGAEAFDRLEAERENLLAAHRRFLGTAPGLAARIGLALGPVFTRQGTLEAELMLLEGTTDAARRSEVPLLLMRSLIARAQAFVRAGRFAEGTADADEALALARREGDLVFEGQALFELGAVECFQGRLEDAENFFSRAKSIGEELGDPLTEALACNGLGAVSLYRGDAREAKVHYADAFEKIRQTSNERRQATISINFGLALVATADLTRARQLLQQGLEIVKRRKDRPTQGCALINLGNVAIAEGNLDAASAYCLEALPIVRRAGNLRFEAAAIGSLGQIALERGELQEARERLEQAIGMLEECGDRHLAFQLVPLLGGTYALLGLERAARQSLLELRASKGNAGDEALLAAAEAIEALVDLVAARKTLPAGEAAALEESARSRLAKIRASEIRRSETLAQALRIVEGFLAGGGAAPVGRSGRLVVGRDATWFELSGLGRVGLGSRGPLRRLLLALVEQRLVAPGVGLGLEELAAAAWPGERILPKAAANRVYNGVRTLRIMGLEDALLRHDDGYLLSPTLSVEKAAP